MSNNKIRELINEWDPINLIHSGAPNNEYDYEINQIINNIYDEIDAENLAKSIYDTFIESFGNDVFIKNFNECFEISIKYFNAIDRIT